MIFLVGVMRKECTYYGTYCQEETRGQASLIIVIALAGSEKQFWVIGFDGGFYFIQCH